VKTPPDKEAFSVFLVVAVLAHSSAFATEPVSIEFVLFNS